MKEQYKNSGTGQKQYWSRWSKYR